MDRVSNSKTTTKMLDASRRNRHFPASKPDRVEACPTEDDSLAKCVTACQSGDRGAQRQLYEACHRNVFRLAMRMVGTQDAADVTQQVFLQVFRSIGQFQGWSHFKTWLYRLAVNESLQHLRRRRRWRHRELDWDPVDETSRTDAAERKELLQRALQRIEPELRAIFLLREVDTLSYHEIAEALKIPEGTVGSRLNRARRELQRHLSELGYTS
jgi:RNA polymerase sigma-70 factor (ECF subfamily)